MDTDQLLKEIASYQSGQSRKNLVAVADRVRDSYANPGERERLRKRFTQMLGSEATIDSKRFACKQLSLIGTAQDVPALGKLLTDDRLSHTARIALERIPGPESDAALRDALSKTKGKLLIGVINSLGECPDRESVAALTRLVTDEDETVASAAAAALGKIGGRQAVQALMKARSAASPKTRPIVADALLNCAKRLLDRGRSNPAARLYGELADSGETEPIREAARRGLTAAR